MFSNFVFAFEALLNTWFCILLLKGPVIVKMLSLFILNYGLSDFIRLMMTAWQKMDMLYSFTVLFSNYPLV